MTYPVTPRGPANQAITLLRVFLWVIPAMFIPVSVVIAGMFTDLLYGHDAAATLGICLLGVVIATAAVGFLDRRLDLMQKKIAPPHSKMDLVRCTIIFFLAQIIIAPTICFAAFFLYCMIQGNI